MVYFMFLFLSFMYLFLSFWCLKMMIFIIFELNLNLKVIFFDMNFFFFIDWMVSMFLFIVYFISALVMNYSLSYMDSDKNKKYFLWLMIFFVLSMNMMVIMPNLFMIILGWDGLGLVSYLLVIFYKNELSNSSGMITVMTNRLGDVGLLMSIIYLSMFSSWNLISFNNENEMFKLLIILMMMGAMTKSAQMPFSSWLPAAMAAPTPVSSLVHSSTLVTAGVYLMIRMSGFFSNGSISEFLLIVSVLTTIMSGIGALYEMDLKKIIALSTLSQLGVMMMIISLGSEKLAFFHLLTHALFKALLFLSAGVLIHNLSGLQDIRKLDNLSSYSPQILMIMVVSSLSLMGFPYLSGFYSKDKILELMYMFNNSKIMILLLFFSVLLTVMYSFRVIFYLMKESFFLKLNNYLDEENMIKPMVNMLKMVIFLGSLLEWVMIYEPIEMNLYIFVKMINLGLVMIGVILMFFFYMKAFLKEKIFLGFFFGKMWFLEEVSLIFLLKMKKLKFYMKNIEMWIEYLSGVGFNYQLKKMNLFLMKFQLSKFYNNLHIMLMILLLFLILN
uniref:NADH dehydrogenase subunit 5 n=1 Tax=Cosmolaelaps hrdyi TaxID=3126097 RepID=UPI0030E3E5CB